MRRTLIALALLFVLGIPVAHAAEPSDTDTDGDGISNEEELGLWHTSPENLDTDSDGFSDGLEIQSGYDPLVPEGMKLKKKIVVDLKTQRLTYYIGPLSLGTSPVSTGKPGMATPKGTFTIQNKKPRAWSSMAHLWMPWWLGFIGTTYGIHELPEWPGGFKEGANHLGKPVSHGCIRLGIGPAKTLYDWAEVGTSVVIQ